MTFLSTAPDRQQATGAVAFPPRPAPGTATITDLLAPQRVRCSRNRPRPEHNVLPKSPPQRALSTSPALSTGLERAIFLPPYFLLGAQTTALRQRKAGRWADPARPHTGPAPSPRHAGPAAATAAMGAWTR